MNLRFVPAGDRALMIYLGNEIAPAVNDQVHALARALRALGHPAIVEVTPSYHCVMVEYDPVRLRVEQLEELVHEAAGAAGGNAGATRTIEIPVLYGGEMGPDIENVATHAALTVADVIRRHTKPLYRVYALGFSPGFSYLGGLDPAIHTPRLAEPRVKVPGGSVGIGGSQTGIYPAPSPGGWQLIGRTPIQLFNPFMDPPALLEPGDAIRFVPISESLYATVEAQATRSRPPVPAYAEGKTGLRVITPGLSTTLQDLGRRGYMAYGVSPAGAVDFWSLMIGNWLMGNRARTSALEITLLGPELEFTGPVAFCLTGSEIPAELIPADGSSPRPVPGWTAYLAGPGDRLRMGSTQNGCRSYLCIAGGFDLDPVLGSLSEDLFGKIGPLGRPLQAGDWLPTGLPLHSPADVAGRHVPAEVIPEISDQAVIRVVRGPQADAFSPEACAAFFSGEYTVGPNSDRQGLRLQGESLAHTGKADILSEPIAPGSIQVPQNGQPILLLGNRQTVGGYTKIGVAVYSDVALAGQLRPGSKVRFQEVDLAEAHAIAWHDRRRLAHVRRLLQRSIGQPVDGVSFTLNLPPAVPAAPAPVEVAAPAPEPVPQAPEAAPLEEARVRTFRISIGDITYEATVEEVE